MAIAMAGRTPDAGARPLRTLGLGIGLVGAFVAGRAMRNLLYGVQPMNPVVLATVAAALAGVALVAAAVPARRARRIDPAVALAAN